MKSLMKCVPKVSLLCLFICVCWGKSTTSGIQSYPSLSLCVHARTRVHKHTHCTAPQGVFEQKPSLSVINGSRKTREQENTSKRGPNEKVWWKKKPVSCWVCLKHVTGTNYTCTHIICTWIKKVYLVHVMSHLKQDTNYEGINSFCIFSGELIAYFW